MIYFQADIHFKMGNQT